METEFFTLHEFLLHTKLVSYLLGISFLLGFAALWNFLNAVPESKDKEDKIQ